jgi:2-polyprenyl-3-methyl-5-hydroxy-6-metoxy-1,4-benzoquinol methylase
MAETDGKGYKVVGIDARQQPIDLVNSSSHPPDITIDASKTSIEEAQKQIAKLRPNDYVGWPGVDGMSLPALLLPWLP